MEEESFSDKTEFSVPSQNSTTMETGLLLKAGNNFIEWLETTVCIQVVRECRRFKKEILHYNIIYNIILKTNY